MRHLSATLLAVVLTLFAARATTAQDIEGYIDFNQTVERQIAQLERLVGGDLDARKQAVAYQWLIDLYHYVGKLDDVDRCYRSILSFFPDDVGTMNAYARFLMDDRKDNARAEEILKAAYARASATDTRSIDIGTTYQLRAELERRAGRYESAVALAGRAVELMSDERAADAMRIRAQSLLALERYDDAAEQYLRLIGIERGTNLEDVNALQLFASKTTRYGSGSVQSLVDGAIADARKRYLSRIELEGGSLVEVTSSDGAKLEGTLRRTEGPGAVLFVPDTGGLRSEFTPYAQILFVDDISSLAVDLRGQGGSRADSLQSYETLSQYNRDMLVEDVIAAYRYLQGSLGLDESHVAVVAAGHACALVEKALRDGRIAAPVVHISPVFPEFDPDLRSALAYHPDRPALFISAREDLSSMRSIRTFPGIEARSHSEVRAYSDAGHGLETLRRSPDALEDFQGWLRGTVGSS
jgi:tetratricopeptide (TPR) repeat protein